MFHDVGAALSVWCMETRVGLHMLKVNRCSAIGQAHFVILISSLYRMLNCSVGVYGVRLQLRLRLASFHWQHDF
jgi:hypothetical protein